MCQLSSVSWNEEYVNDVVFCDLIKLENRMYRLERTSGSGYWREEYVFGLPENTTNESSLVAQLLFKNTSLRNRGFRVKEFIRTDFKGE